MGYWPSPEDLMCLHRFSNTTDQVPNSTISRSYTLHYSYRDGEFSRVWGISQHSRSWVGDSPITILFHKKPCPFTSLIKHIFLWKVKEISPSPFGLDFETLYFRLGLDNCIDTSFTFTVASFTSYSFLPFFFLLSHSLHLRLFYENDIVSSGIKCTVRGENHKPTNHCTSYICLICLCFIKWKC